jgi:hypothetical protein
MVLSHGLRRRETADPSASIRDAVAKSTLFLMDLVSRRDSHCPEPPHKIATDWRRARNPSWCGQRNFHLDSDVDVCVLLGGGLRRSSGGTSKLHIKRRFSAESHIDSSWEGCRWGVSRRIAVIYLRVAHRWLNASPPSSRNSSVTKRLFPNNPACALCASPVKLTYARTTLARGRRILWRTDLALHTLRVACLTRGFQDLRANPDCAPDL